MLFCKNAIRHGKAGVAEVQDIPCVGVCMPDEDEMYCIGCGRPWGSAPVPAPSFHVIERGWPSSNNILLFDGDEATLIDSGHVGNADQTVELVKSALAGRRLVRLINTKSHSDHIGGNAALQREFGCEILIPVGIEERIAHWDAQRGDRFRYDGVVRPDETLRMGGVDWRAHVAPGHDMDALLFHCAEARILISGDALWVDDGGALRATRKTLDMIAGLAVDTVIPGHGKPFGDVSVVLERAYARLRPTMAA